VISDELDVGVFGDYISSVMNRHVVVALLLAVLVTSTAGAADIVRGDIVRSADPPAIMCPTPPRTAVLSSSLDFKSWLWTGDAVAFDSVGNLYAAGQTTLESFDSTLQTIRKIDLGEKVTALAVDAAGFAYVVTHGGTTVVVSPGGAVQRSFVLPNLHTPVDSTSIDVTPAACTLVYIGDGASLNRFDVCAQIALGPIAAGERFEAVRALSDGGVVAATAGLIKFYDSNGSLRYSVAAPAGGPIAALSFDLDDHSLWIANGEFLVRMNIFTQAITARTRILNPRAVAVFGERRLSSANVPTVVPPRHRASR